ncbi:hypothetical protein MKW98_026172 [Papaver atlanticum]|uniref:Uncharacterized protein n=1 Tax=Papaver atlanticum TaxID=357466 RepID=A0AAD4THL1_9MAGN|nr:hypothetical protein MKW98_026172 [Papaver atlanticum]
MAAFTRSICRPGLNRYKKNTLKSLNQLMDKVRSLLSWTNSLIKRQCGKLVVYAWIRVLFTCLDLTHLMLLIDLRDSRVEDGVQMDFL